MAIAEQYFQWKMEENMCLKRRTNEISQLLGDIATGTGDIQTYREHYEAFIQHHKSVLETMFGLGPRQQEVSLAELLDELSSQSSKMQSGNTELQILIGGLVRLVETRASEDLLLFTLIFSLSNLPFTCIPLLFSLINIPVREAIQVAFQQWLNKIEGKPFSLELKVPENDATWEKDLLKDYLDGLREDNLGKVARFMQHWDMGFRDTLGDFFYSLLILAYYTDKDLFIKVSLIDDQPVMISCILEHFPFANDICVLQNLALKGNSWASVEIYRFFLEKLRELEGHGPNFHLAPSKVTAFRRTLIILIGRILKKIAREQKGHLRFLLEDIYTGTHSFNPDAYSLWGRCI